MRRSYDNFCIDPQSLVGISLLPVADITSSQSQGFFNSVLLAHPFYHCEFLLVDVSPLTKQFIVPLLSAYSLQSAAIALNILHKTTDSISWLLCSRIARNNWWANRRACEFPPPPQLPQRYQAEVSEAVGECKSTKSKTMERRHLGNTYPALKVLLIEPARSRSRVAELLKSPALQPVIVQQVRQLDEAIVAAKKTRFGAIIAILPRDSYSTEQLRKLREASEAALVVVTDLAAHEFIQSSLRELSDDCLFKGELDESSLLRALSYAMERCDVRLALANAEADKKKLNSRLSFMERVLRFIGHELRTPLATVRLSLEMAQMNRERNNEEGVEGLVRSAENSADRTVNLLTGLIDAARLASNTVSFNWQYINVADAITTAINASSHARQPGVTLNAEVLSENIVIRGDFDYFVRLLVELLTNSLKATSQGSCSLVVTDDVTGDENFIELTISDTGSGIPQRILTLLDGEEDVADDLLGEHYITNRAQGIAICRGIVMAFGGEMEVSSSSKSGTQVTVRLRSDLNKPLDSSSGSRLRLRRPDEITTH